MPDLTLYAAKKKYKEQVNLFFEKNQGISIPIEVIFSNEIEETQLDSSNNGILAKYQSTRLFKTSKG